MTIKKIALATLSTGLLLAVFANPKHIEAVGTDSSEANVEFTAPSDAVGPVDPSNPSEPHPDENIGDTGNVTSQEGPLSLDYISHIDFGSHDINTSEETYSSTTSEPFIQVTDRRGTGAGWQVTATANSFENEGEVSLPGSTISFLNGAVDSDSNTDAPEPNTAINLETGGDAVDVVTAQPATDGLDTAQGLGTWVMSWLTESDENDNVTLTVPEAAASPGNHTATIDWTLSNGPGNDGPGE